MKTFVKCVLLCFKPAESCLSHSVEFPVIWLGKFYISIFALFVELNIEDDFSLLLHTKYGAIHAHVQLLMCPVYWNQLEMFIFSSTKLIFLQWEREHTKKLTYRKSYEFINWWYKQKWMRETLLKSWSGIIFLWHFDMLVKSVHVKHKYIRWNNK